MEIIMRIFDESKQTELKEIDREAGRLVPDRLFIAHHDAREASEEIGHYEVIREYKNGGKDVKWVVDKPAVTACEEHDEYEDILVFVPYTEEELAKVIEQRLRKSIPLKKTAKVSDPAKATVKKGSKTVTPKSVSKATKPAAKAPKTPTPKKRKG